jgi:hypothetical protein
MGKPHAKGSSGKSPVGSTNRELEEELLEEHENGLELDPMDETAAFMGEEAKEAFDPRQLRARSSRGAKRRAGPGDLEEEELESPLNNDSGEKALDALAEPPKKKVSHGISPNSSAKRAGQSQRRPKMVGSSSTPNWKKIDDSSNTYVYQPPESANDMKLSDAYGSQKQLIFKPGWPRVTPSLAPWHSEFQSIPARTEEIQFRSGLPKSILKSIEAGNHGTVQQEQLIHDKVENGFQALHSADGDTEMFWSEHVQTVAPPENRMAQAPVFVSIYPPGGTHFSSTPTTTTFDFINVESPFTPTKKVRNNGNNPAPPPAEPPTSRGRRRSPLWAHFSLSNDKYICLACKHANMIGAYFSTSATTRTLRKHISSHHPILAAQLGLDIEPTAPSLPPPEEGLDPVLDDELGPVDHMELEVEPEPEPEVEPDPEPEIEPEPEPGDEPEHEVGGHEIDL